VPEALERRTLWLAPEQIADRTVPDVVALIGESGARALAEELRAYLIES
jgi:hypothetical protein